MSNDNLVKLKPCPFCGGEAVRAYEYTYDKKSIAFVCCYKCAARAYGRSTDHPINARWSADSAWNLRPTGRRPKR